MEKPQTVVIGAGAVASAIAGKLSAAGHDVMQVALAGGSPLSLPALAVPPTFWPLPEAPTLPAPADPLMVDHIRLDQTDGKFEVVMDNQPIIAPDYIVITSARAAAQLLPLLNMRLPLRPVRCHVQATGVQLGSTSVQASIAQATHLSRGSILNAPEKNRIFYDGLLDARQATFSREPDPVVQAALHKWLEKQGVEAQGEPAIVTTAITPDFMPAFGPWQIVESKELPQLWLAVGWHVWGPAIAGSVAAKLAGLMAGEMNTDNDITRLNPTRFQTGNWQKTDRPTWLPAYAQPQLNASAEVTRADTVQTIDNPDIERSKNVQMTEGPVTQRADTVQMGSSRSKVQAAPLKMK